MNADHFTPRRPGNDQDRKHHSMRMGLEDLIDGLVIGRHLSDRIVNDSDGPITVMARGRDQVRCLLTQQASRSP